MKFPPYRFVPGEFPHPRRDPKGHSYGEPEPVAQPFSPDAWRDSEMYLHGIALYNDEYWWECHEMLEAIWHAVGHETEQGQFLQGIIQVAAANLQRRKGAKDVAKDLSEKGLGRHQGIEGVYMGVDVAKFASDVRDYFSGRSEQAARITLEGKS